MTINQPRLLTLKELAALVQGYRTLRLWTQEDLADISGVSVQTIQSVEDEQASDEDDLRALAEAFDFADVDVFIKPFSWPASEDFETEGEDDHSEHVTLEAFVLTTGEELAQLVESSQADVVSQSFEMGMQADKVFAALIDYSREYRDCFPEYSELKKNNMYEELQEYLSELRFLGVSVCYATRRIESHRTQNPSAQQRSIDILYLVTFALGEEPESFVAMRNMTF